jgi:hypothetical protein
VFEIHPLWEPSLDRGPISTLMFLSTKKLTRFERTAFSAAKVRNVSGVGSQIQ